MSDLTAKYRRKLLFMTLEPITEAMAGPAIRCLEMGKALCDEFDVTVFSPHACQISPQIKSNQLPGLNLALGVGRGQLAQLARQSEVVIVQANVLKAYPAIARLAKYLVVDLYDPYLFSIHVQWQGDPHTASSSFRLMHQVLQQHMVRADFSICASERQRDYWIGRFCALGRIDPALYNFDPSLRKLIDIVPFGLAARHPERNGPGLRDRIEAIHPEDPVLLWGGGIWDWFDPITIIKAVAALVSTIPNLRLVFMGSKSPNPQVPLMKMALKARNLSDSLHLTGKHIFFPGEWVDYLDRVNYLLDADIAVSAHFDLPETRYSYRTRMLDYIWARLPMITTGGDSLSDLVEATGCGIVVPYEDTGAWQNAISKMIGDVDFARAARTNVARLCQEFTWSKVIGPLRSYCRNPYRLPPYRRVTKPTAVERARAVYLRGGKELVIKRSRQLLKDLLP
jgi:glycosyltransferase involved in cell wall biosynthesis